jgi:hypothetical protein
MLRRKRVLIAVGIGTTTAFALTGLAAVVDELGYESAARILVWPNALLQSFVPPHNIGTPEHAVLEGSPLNGFAFVASVLIAAIVYSMPAFSVVPRLLAWVRRHC